MNDIIVVKLDAAKMLLAQVSNASGAKHVVDMAHAAEVYARRQKCSLEVIEHAHAIKVDAMTLLGEYLKRAEKAPAGRPVKIGPTVQPISPPPTLAALNLTRNESSDAQALAALKVEAPTEHEEVRTGKKSIRAAAATHRRKKRAKQNAKVEAEVAPVAPDDRWRVDEGDCLKWLADQPANSINLVFGSPPYEQARLYLENGEDKGIARKVSEWVVWMADVYEAALKCCNGLVAFVVEGQTKQYRWSASPVLLMAALHERGIALRKPPIYHRVGIPGSGGTDWLRNDYEFIICATRGGQLPWSENTAMGEPPVYGPGGDPSHRTQDGSRVNGESGPATMTDRKNVGHHRARHQAGSIYSPPEVANPGNVITCTVGGGQMGDPLSHENEAPFPESLAEFFVRSFCPPGGVVADPFSGSGTTGAVAVRFNRRFIGCDIRASQVDLSRRRIARVQPLIPNIGA